MIIYYKVLVFTPRIQRWYNMQNKQCICQINEEQKLYTYLNRENAFDKMQYLFILKNKTLS